MNAYELADQVEKWGNDFVALSPKGGACVIEAAKMLRQQAKELDEAGHMIGVLREYISDLENGLDSSIKLNKAQAERFAELEVKHKQEFDYAEKLLKERG